MDMVSIQIRRDVFERLQKLAVPLVDDISTVIERELDSLKEMRGSSPAITSQSHPKIWHSSRGESFPVGTKLRARYLHEQYLAEVTAQGIEFNTEYYDSPSSAAIAVKKAAGKSGDAARANGWNFWEMQDPSTGKWRSIDLLRFPRS